MAYCLINKSNYFYNLSQIEKRIDKDKIAVVIKNNAYGHGIIEIAKLAHEYGLKHKVVNNLTEAQSIYNLFETVIVLQEIPTEKVEENIIITINSIDSIKQIASGTKVELKVDTGMHRNGVSTKDIPVALDLIDNNKLILNGIFTHFSSAYLGDSSLSSQKDTFDKIRLDVVNDSRFDNNVRFHCCASSSLFRVDNSVYDLARVGIMSYGYVSLPESYKKPELRPVLSLWGEKTGLNSGFLYDSGSETYPYDMIPTLAKS
jgi:alanine racemase